MLALRILSVIGPLMGLMLLSRPKADDWPAAVERMRRKERHGAGTLATSLEPARAVWASSEQRWHDIGMMAAQQFTFGSRAWPEEKLWAMDAVLLSAGCTHKKCFVGVLGSWRKLPCAAIDLYILAAAHGSAIAVFYHFGPTVFYQHCAPRFSAPYTILTGAFATSSLFEMMWLTSTLFGLGHDLQRSIGRVRFLLLWLGGAGSVSLVAASLRHSCSGAGGVIAAFTYHAIVAPRAQYNIFGMRPWLNLMSCDDPHNHSQPVTPCIRRTHRLPCTFEAGITLGVRTALVVQMAIVAWPALGGASGRLGVVAALNLAPMAIGAAFYLLQVVNA